MNVYKIQVLEPNSDQLRIICIYDGISCKELRSICVAAFQNDNYHINSMENIIGFQDQINTLYPIYIIAKFASSFKDKSLKLITYATANVIDKLKHGSNPNDSYFSNSLADSETDDFSMQTDEGAETAFKLLDINGDNLVHKEEFIDVLCIAFEHLLESDSRYKFAYSCISPKDLAIGTAIQCYSSINNGGNYYLSYGEFCAWYFSSTTFSPSRDLAIVAIESLSSIPLPEGDENKSLIRNKSTTSLLLRSKTATQKLKHFITNCRTYLRLHGDNTEKLFKILLKSNETAMEYFTRTEFMNIFSNIYFTRNTDLAKNVGFDSQLMGVLEQIFNLVGSSSNDRILIHSLVAFVVLVTEMKPDVTLPLFFKFFSQNEHYKNGSDKRDLNYVNDSILYYFLLQLVKIIFYCNSDLPATTGCRPNDVAHAISTKFLMITDANREIRFKLNYVEFLEVLSHSMKLGLDMLQIGEGHFDSFLSQVIEAGVTQFNGKKESNDKVPEYLEDSQIESFFVQYDGGSIPLMEAKVILGLELLPPYDVLSQMRSVCNSKGKLNQLDYNKCISKMISHHYIALSVLERSIADFVFERLFSIFEDNANPCSTNIRVLGVGLLLFCGGSYQSRANAAFDLLELLVSPRITHTKHHMNPLVVTQSIADLLKAKAALDPRKIDMNRIDEDAKNYGMEFIAKIKHKDTDENFVISKDRFIDMFSSILEMIDATKDEAQIAATDLKVFDKATDGDDDSSANQMSFSAFSGDGDDEDEENPYLDDAQYPPSSMVLELRAARSILGLETMQSDDIMERLGKFAIIGRLSLQSWMKWVSASIAQADVSNQDVKIAISLAERLFEVLKISDSNEDTISFTHIVCGLSFLCGGSPLEEKIMVAFAVSDSNSDGYITSQEYEEMVVAVIKTISVCSKHATDKIVLCGKSIRILAKAAAKEGLNALNISAEEELSLDMVTELAEDYLKLAAIY
eukprot:gene12080-16166_t